MKRKTKKTLGIIIGLIAIIGILAVFNILNITGNEVKTDESIKIGVILPLTGPGAYWGEAIREGIDMGKIDLLQKGIRVEVIYEDSEAKPAKGVTAFNKLNSIDDVDVMVSAFSSVSTPLVTLADANKIPLFTTIASVEGLADQSEYVFRYFNDNRQYVDPHFDNWNTEKYDEIAILYLNDEYGHSVADTVKKAAKEKNVKVVAEEVFEFGSNDFRTQLTKIKSKEPKALIFIGSLPPEVINTVKQIKELGLEVDLFETSILLSLDFIRESIKKEVEGVHTTAFDFTLGGGVGFKERYKLKYEKEPFFASALGYDIVTLIGEASKGNKISGDEFVENVLGMKSFDGVSGVVEIKPNGEINPRIRAVKIVNGELVLV